MARRKKSINDLMEQASRIEWALLDRGYGGASRRYQNVERTMARYTRNAGAAIGGDLAKRGYWFADDSVDRDRKVSRSTYMGLSNG